MRSFAVVTIWLKYPIRRIYRNKIEDVKMQKEFITRDINRIKTMEIQIVSSPFV